jgi:hypothetical protein
LVSMSAVRAIGNAEETGRKGRVVRLGDLIKKWT